METLDSIELADIEKIADDEFLAAPLPHTMRDIAIWHLLTAVEDFARFQLAGWIKVGDLQTILISIDQGKYSLRHCIDYINSKSYNARISLPVKTVPESYKKAHELFMAGLKYAKVAKLFTTTYGNFSTLVKEQDGYRVKFGESFNVGYSALEILNHGREESSDITGYLYHWLTDSVKSEFLSSKIVKHTRLKRGRIIYKYDPGIVYELSLQLPQRYEIIPDDFAFPWGGAYETHALINSLHVRCLYHLLAVEYTARAKSIKGGAESSLVLTIEKESLRQDLEYLADVGEKNIQSFIEFMTFGYGSKTPDPSLQPLLRTADGVLLVPCAHIITSNSQRNILALMARIMPTDFDRQSKHFEIKMTKALSLNLSSWPLHQLNREYRGNGSFEELDVVIVDKEHKFVLVFELRWMIQPGDPREILNRVNVCAQKVKQLDRKLSFVRNNLSEVLSRISSDIGPIATSSDWTVRGIVVVQGFGGHISPMPDIPLITLEVLIVGLNRIHRLQALYDWVKSLSWLPKEGIHFSLVTEEILVASTIIRRPGMVLISNEKDYLSYIQEGISAVQAAY